MKIIQFAFLFVLMSFWACNNGGSEESSEDSGDQLEQGEVEDGEDNDPNSADLINNSSTANGEGEDGAMAEINFEKKVHDFGEITAGEKVSYSFKFENTGDNPLIIANAKASCGCTVPNYTKEPVAPGEDGVIDVVFNSAGKSGMQKKSITIKANTKPALTVLQIRGNVVEK